MPPKKSAAAAPKKAAAAAPAHTSYQAMISDAILALKERSGSSRQAIKKYVKANNKIGDITDAQFNSHVNRAIQQGVEKGHFDQPKGASGPVKLKKSDKKVEKKASPPATKKEAPKKVAAPRKTVEKKAAPAKKATATKKAAAPKKAAATKAAPKKAAAKPKANAGRPRKASAAAPAVEDKPATVLGKTKSGRVTKTKAPQTKAAAKKAGAKKAAPAKKATPKKGTPKKAEAEAKA
ncbi:Histone H1/H5 [Botryosphaeria dothidea]|uniref:Histone H1 n=1 Tax=Botryosphaeria dothidea TaxID=55169 RepID=A0A8H4N314_9PEZI|nr:Histone H1/H5 [Botryosphaeria dothidea]